MYLLNNDVHTYTSFLKTQLHRVSHLKPIDKAELLDILRKYSKPQLCPSVANIVRSITEQGTIPDPDLGGYDCAPLIKELDMICSNALEETLIEIGTTCRQGISHRLLWLYLTLTEFEGGEECNPTPSHE